MNLCVNVNNILKDFDFFTGATMEAECLVYFHSFQPEGEHVPKLLPCSHCLCLHCLQKMLQVGFLYSQITCPECRKPHQVPKAMGPQEFPTNRYMTENMELASRMNQMRLQQQQDQGQRQLEADLHSITAPASCPTHGKLFVMFCTEVQWATLLCPLCPIVKHTDYHLVGLHENLKDTDIGKQKEKISDQLQTLECFQRKVSKLKENLNTKAEVAEKAVEERKEAIVQKVLIEAKNLRHRINEIKNQEMEKLTQLGDVINTCEKTGHDVQAWMTDLPDGTLQESLKEVQHFMHKNQEFDKSFCDIKTTKFQAHYP